MTEQGAQGGLPREIEKPWGSELWWAWTEHYAAQLLQVRSPQKLSVQYHLEKDETSYLFSGRLRIDQGASPERMRCREIAAGEVWRNEPGVVHTLLALEVSTPQLDDVVRIADRYGRLASDGAEHG